MPLETPSFINDFVNTNPVGGSDPKSEGDDHIRNMKIALKATFPGMAGRFRRTQTRSSAYTAVLNDNTSILRTSGTWTLALDPAATLGNGWEILIYNDGAGTITVDPDGTEIINAGATLTIAPNTFVWISCNGTLFLAVVAPINLANVATTDTAQTLTNKTVNLSSNTLVGTTAQFNAANSDADFYTSGGPDVTVADGGTGASTAAGARTNLGAPWVQADIGAAAVGQAQLSVATSDVGNSGDGANFVQSGGYFMFWPNVSVTGIATTSRKAAHVYDNQAQTTNFADTNFVWLDGDLSEVGVMHAHARYVQASPPYDLGNGDIPLFVFLLIDSTGKVIASSVAEDPPWANNGPTVINPLGRLHRLVSGPDRLRDVAEAPVRRQAFFDSLRATHRLMTSTDPKDIQTVRSVLNTPVTQAEKQADMPLIPHPFISVRNPGATTVILDPVGSITEDLWLAQKYGGDKASDVIWQGALILDNAPILGVIVPPGVMPVRARWKLTP